MHGFITKIQPNNKQRTMFERHAGTARHAWNWSLNLCIENLRNDKYPPSAIDLHKLLVKDVKPENPWYYDSSKCAPQEALRNLEKAFKKFWQDRKSRTKLKDKYHKRFIKQFAKGELKKLTIEHEKGFPRFKKKAMHNSFYLEGNIQAIYNRIKVPKIGWLKTYEHLPEGVYKNVTISKRGQNWFISFKAETEKKLDTSKQKGATGVDLGIKALAVTSENINFESPKAYKTNKSKLVRIQKKLSRQYEACKKDKDGRKVYGNNYKKTQLKLSKIHNRISNIRKDATHKLTSYLVKNHNRICIEDLNISGMMKNHNLASAISDGGFYEFKRQLEYKCKWNNTELIIADRFFASSKTCSCCGHKQPMPLKKRVFTCEKCGISLDRDLNAAINLRNYAVSYTVKACGDAKFHDASQVGVGEAGIRQQSGDVQNCVGSQ